jgi:hypothetical protein
MAKKPRDDDWTYGGGRKRESTYLEPDLAKRWRRFVLEREWLHTKSKALGAAVEFYLHYADLYGLDEKHWPNIQPAMEFYEYAKKKYGLDSRRWPRVEGHKST